MRPYIEEMERITAEALGIAADQVNIKATTEEGLGFTGVEEGISAQAICAISAIYENSIAVADSGAGGCSSCMGCNRV
jgi:2-C-methyl-D-erythritol 2,4-cyclodiphosphate synthase